MARHRNAAPSYLLHKQSGRGRLIWTDPLGIRQEKLLPGLFGSTESLAAKARLELELAVSPLPAAAAEAGVSTNEVLLAFLKHAEGHYRRADGSTTNELDEYNHDDQPEVAAANLRHALHCYAELTAIGFHPLLVTWATGGFHLWVLIAGKVPGPVLHAFGRWVVRDAARFGAETPEANPKQSRVKAFGNWLRVRGADHGIWRRLRLVPFQVTFWKDADRALDPAAESETGPGKKYDPAFRADPGLLDRLRGRSGRACSRTWSNTPSRSTGPGGPSTRPTRWRR